MGMNPAVGGALAGAGSGAAMGSVAGPYGMAAGAVIGGVMGGLSGSGAMGGSDSLKYFRMARNYNRKTQLGVERRLEGFGAQQIADIDKDYDTRASTVMQSLYSRGLGGASGSVLAGLERSRQLTKNRATESLQGLKANTYLSARGANSQLLGNTQWDDSNPLTDAIGPFANQLGQMFANQFSPGMQASAMNYGGMGGGGSNQGPMVSGNPLQGQNGPVPLFGG